MAKRILLLLGVTVPANLGYQTRLSQAEWKTGDGWREWNESLKRKDDFLRNDFFLTLFGAGVLHSLVCAGFIKIGFILNENMQ